MPDLLLAQERATVDAPLVAWYGMYGSLCVALKHPELGAVPSAQELLGGLKDALEALLRDSGFLTEADLVEMRPAETETTPT